MSKFLSVLGALVITTSMFAQTFDEKTFLKTLPKAKKDTNKVNSLNSYSKYLIKENNYEKALQFSDSAILLSRKLKFGRGEITACENSCFILSSNKEFAKSLAFDKRKLELFTLAKNKTAIADCNRSIADSYFNLAETDSAMVYYQFALTDYKDSGRKKEMASVSDGLGKCYLVKKNYGKAITFSKNALTLLEELNDKRALVDVYSDLVKLYDEIGDSGKAMDYKQKMNRLKKETEEGLGTK